jgi:PAS domain-containing protein
MNTSAISWLFENYGILTAGLSTAVGIFLFLKKWIKNAIRSFHLSDKFHALFGDNPAEKIKEDQELHRFAKDLLEIRLSISEQWLKIGVYICNKDGECTWTNEHLNNTFGLDSQEMLGFGWLSAIENSDRKRVNEEWIYAIENKIPYDSEYKVVNNRDNLLILVKTKALAVVDQDNNVKCYIGYLRENVRSPLSKTKNEKKKTEESP